MFLIIVREVGTMATLTMKFGGTSVGSPEAISQAAEIVLANRQDWERIVVVVSAMRGVTDALAQGALTAASGDNRTYREIHSNLLSLHQDVVDALLPTGGEHAELTTVLGKFLEEFSTLCHSVYILGEVTPRAMDTIMALGERLNARILAALLRIRGAQSKAMDATELIVTDDQFQNAAPIMEATRARISSGLVPILEEGIIPVVTGFIAATKEGVTTTLSRGGSDYTAAILGDCLDADEVWIWTDVDGVMTADPRIVGDARAIPALSYSEVSEMAYFGAKVLHPKTIRPIIERNIPLWVKNTFNPSYPGTRILCDPEVPDGEIKAVTAIHGLSMITVEGRGMLGVPGIAARTFASVASQGVSVLMISQASSEQSICFMIPMQTVPAVQEAIEQEMALELARRDIDQIWSMDDVVIVTAVGAGMRSTPGIAARIFGALGESEINVIAIAQGSSECSMSLVVEAGDAVNAIRQIHKEVGIHG
jgi:aspartokinase/homoserine dehydrogenase 1